MAYQRMCRLWIIAVSDGVSKDDDACWVVDMMIRMCEMIAEQMCEMIAEHATCEDWGDMASNYARTACDIMDHADPVLTAAPCSKRRARFPTLFRGLRMLWRTR